MSNSGKARLVRASAEGSSSSTIPSTREDLERRFRSRYGDVTKFGWRMRLKRRFGYFDPDSWYEAAVDRLVGEGSEWVDVGGGKSVLPSDETLAATLSQRCAFLLGVDPSENIVENRCLHEKAQCTIEEYHGHRSFDLATLRMVAEHIEDPQQVVAALARLMKPGGKVVVYTPYRWSPSAIVASMTPLRIHQVVANCLWESREEDVFPTVYRMNTRSRLRTVFEQRGFKEIEFAYLDHCAASARFRVLYAMELSVWRLLRMIGLKYPECTLLAVYQKT